MNLNAGDGSRRKGASDACECAEIHDEAETQNRSRASTVARLVHVHRFEGDTERQDAQQKSSRRTPARDRHGSVADLPEALLLHRKVDVRTRTATWWAKLRARLTSSPTKRTWSSNHRDAHSAIRGPLSTIFAICHCSIAVVGAKATKWRRVSAQLLDTLSTTPLVKQDEAEKRRNQELPRRCCASASAGCAGVRGRCVVDVVPDPTHAAPLATERARRNIEVERSTQNTSVTHGDAEGLRKRMEEGRSRCRRRCRLPL